MVESINNQSPMEKPLSFLSSEENEFLKKKSALDEKLEELMETLEFALKKFDDSAPSFAQIKQINKTAAVLRKTSPKEPEAATIETYQLQVEETCSKYYKQLELILNAERDRVLDLQRQSRQKFLEEQMLTQQYTEQ
jgi:hypothetical protein